MLSRIHSKLGTAGLVIAIVALVVALTGAAFAAGGLTKQQEKQVKKIAKKYAGKRGPQGKQGIPGAQGPAGAPGAKGDTGAPGAPGKNGTNGTNGTNGEDGACSNENPVCTLPPLATETGAFTTGIFTSNGQSAFGISFNLPLESAPTFVYMKEGVTSASCPGEGEAEPGFLCLYAKKELGSIAT